MILILFHTDDKIRYRFGLRYTQNVIWVWISNFLDSGHEFCTLIYFDVTISGFTKFLCTTLHKLHKNNFKFEQFCRASHHVTSSTDNFIQIEITNSLLSTIQNSKILTCLAKLNLQRHNFESPNCEHLRTDVKITSCKTHG